MPRKKSGKWKERQRANEHFGQSSFHHFSILLVKQPLRLFCHDNSNEIRLQKGHVWLCPGFLLTRHRVLMILSNPRHSGPSYAYKFVIPTDFFTKEIYGVSKSTEKMKKSTCPRMYSFTGQQLNLYLCFP